MWGPPQSLQVFGSLGIGGVAEGVGGPKRGVLVGVTRGPETVTGTFYKGTM